MRDTRLRGHSRDSGEPGKYGQSNTDKGCCRRSHPVLLGWLGIFLHGVYGRRSRQEDAKDNSARTLNMLMVQTQPTTVLPQSTVTSTWGIREHLRASASANLSS